MTVIFIVIFLLDLVIYAYTTHLLAKQGSTSVHEPPPKIRDSYVGLDELYSTGQINASRHDPIINKPRRVGQVYRMHPNKASPVDAYENCKVVAVTAEKNVAMVDIFKFLVMLCS